MIRRDYHGYKLHEALEDAHNVIAAFRMNRHTKESTEEVEFVVGHGVIRHELNYLLTNYGLTPRIQLANSGVILCTLE